MCDWNPIDTLPASMIGERILIRDTIEGESRLSAGTLIRAFNDCETGAGKFLVPTDATLVEFELAAFDDRSGRYTTGRLTPKAQWRPHV